MLMKKLTEMKCVNDDVITLIRVAIFCEKYRKIKKCIELSSCSNLFTLDLDTD